MNYSEPSKTRNVLAIDLDGVLCNEGHFSEYLLAEPDVLAIDKVNRLYDLGYVIIIHTARLEKDRWVTEHWLRQNGVKFTALVMGKLRADVYVDDKNMTLEEL